MTSLDETARLLAEVFPGTRVSRLDYLRWLYDDSPFGRVIEANLDDDSGRVGHYALVPVDLVRDGMRLEGALSLNTAVHARARGAGVFVRLAQDAYEKALRAGVHAVIGVANANSTPGFVRRLQFRLVAPLPATVLIPTPGRLAGVHSVWADAGAFASGGPVADVTPLLAPSSRGLTRLWTPDTLRWRLADPSTRYALHRTEDALAVSCRAQRHGVGVSIVLKVFARAPLPGATLREIIRAVCRFHRTPVAVHVGMNDLARFRGAPLPTKLREAPLNLIHRSLDGDPREPEIVRFEFLDFDAY